jgi:hypothetical protein
MKLMFFAGLFLPLFIAAQDCKVLREADPYTKETKLSSGFISLQGATVTIDADKNEIDFFFVINDKCFNDASTLVVFFEGTKVKSTYRNSGSMNCEGYFHYKIKNGLVTPTAVKKFATQKVTQLVFTGDDKKQIVVSLQPDQQEIFMKSSECISTEAKTLIK